MVQSLNQFLSELKALKSATKADKSKTVNKTALRKKAEELATAWLSSHSAQLASSGQVSGDVVQKYTELFRQLLKITGPSNLKASYLRLLGSLTKTFREDFILKLHESPPIAPSLALLSTLFKGMPAQEDAYLKEAVGCAQKGFLRASIVIGWCAAIARIHAKIEELGFAAFNVTSAQIASQQKGRFKKFNKVFNVSTMGELREVFDNDILWVLEGMLLIDSNQHTRLHSCFDMRCHSAHPGDAPITEFNLLSFFSDIKEIVFDSAKFRLQNAAPTTPSKLP